MSTRSIHTLILTFTGAATVYLVIAWEVIKYEERLILIAEAELIAQLINIDLNSAEPLHRDTLFSLTKFGREIIDFLSRGKTIDTFPTQSQYSELGFPNENLEDAFQIELTLRMHPEDRAKW